MKFASLLNHDPEPALQWIEVASSLQIPAIQIVGLPGPEVTEARERVRAAITSSGIAIPKRRYLINLSPANVKKRGTGCDLAMALAILTCGKQYDDLPGKYVAWGELSLDGSIRSVGQLTRALYAAWKTGAEAVLIAADVYNDAEDALRCIAEAGIFASVPPQLLGARTLKEAFQVLCSRAENKRPLALLHSAPKRANPPDAPDCPKALPLSPLLERAVCAAALGPHHVIFLGARGTGKSNATDFLAELQSPLRAELGLRNKLISELVRSDDGAPGSKTRTSFNRPVYRVGSQARPAALIGSSGIDHISPGAFSLAHGGLLVADEFPEWSRDTREALREPLETGLVTLSRSRQSAVLPARFTLAANGNLCPCGGWPARFAEHAGNPEPECKCIPTLAARYISRISGPVLDRIDMTVFVPAQTVCLSNDSKHQFKVLSQKVENARALSNNTFEKTPGLLSGQELEELLSDNPAWQTQLDTLNLTSLRSRHKTLRLAISLSLLEGKNSPAAAHFSEAAYYRPERLGL